MQSHFFFQGNPLPYRDAQFFSMLPFLGPAHWIAIQLPDAFATDGLTRSIYSAAPIRNPRDIPQTISI